LFVRINSSLSFAARTLAQGPRTGNASPGGTRVAGWAKAAEASPHLGLDIIPDSPAEFAAVIKAEIPQWAAVIKGAGIESSDQVATGAQKTARLTARGLSIGTCAASIPAG
jgi:hypothetical protein